MRLKSRMTKRRGGFALLVVIWGLGAITLLVVSFSTTSRLRLQTAFNIAGAARAQSIAAAAADLAVLSLAEGRMVKNGPSAAAPQDGAPSFCVIDEAVVAIAIEDESGKVDLNTASETLLQDMLTGLLGMAPEQSGGIAHAIVEFRAPPENDLLRSSTDGMPFAPKHAAFQTALELDQVAGIDAATFRALLPYVTVNSRSEGIDPHVAPPALFAALLGMPRSDVVTLATAPFPNNLNRDDPRFPSADRQAGAHGAFLIHVEVVLPDGPTGVQESIVEAPSSDGAPFALREIRHGSPRYLEVLAVMRTAANTLPPC
jgi:general secretion pathway protein K